MAAAMRTLELARDLAAAAADHHGLALSNRSLLTLSGDTGQWSQAEAAYQAFNQQPPSWNTTLWQSDAQCHYAAMLLYRGLDAGAALDQAGALAVQSHDTEGLRRLHRLRGERALLMGETNVAVEQFQNAITLARKHNAVALAAYLGGLACAHAQQGQRETALTLLAEAFSQPYQDEIHDLYASAAEVYRLLGEIPQAQAYALKAYETAWADGPPFSWWWSLERAQKVLAALGQPYPDLPPFDPARVEKIPYEGEICAFIEALQAKKASDLSAGETR
jgi:tetratricopeptide (TPR) repeat protein